MWEEGWEAHRTFCKEPHDLGMYPPGPYTFGAFSGEIIPSFHIITSE